MGTRISWVEMSFVITDARGGRRPASLKRAMWPAADREAWESACVPSSRLRRGGAAAHLAQITRDDLERRYGYFLDYLDRAGRLDQAACAGGQITPDEVKGFVAELSGRVSSVTGAQTIFKLLRVARILAPSSDFGWLQGIANDLALEATPQSRAHQLTDGAVLLKAGLTLIKEGEHSETLSAIRRARLVRNGLMIAILSLCPIRLKNFTSLNLGDSLRFDGGEWWIALDGHETKVHRPDMRHLHSVLKTRLELYLRAARPVLLRQADCWRPEQSFYLQELQGALWIDSNLGNPMSYSGVEEAVAGATRATLGVTLRPHAFRMCAASTAYVIAGDNPNLASALLQHTDQRVTQKHYNRATQAQAAMAYGKLLNAESLNE